MAKNNQNNEQELDENDSPEENGKSKKWLIIIIIAVLLLAGGGAAAYFLVFAKSGAEKKDVVAEETAAPDREGHEESANEESEGHGEGGKVEKTTGPVYYELPEFLVNLSTAGKQPSFLKMKVTLELRKKADIKIVEGFMPRITDSFNTYLRELRPTDLSGSAGMYRLREELMLRINQAIAPAKVENILFKEVIIQ